MRFLPHTEQERRDMLAAIGVDSTEAFFAAVPAAARVDGLLDLPLHQSELAVARRLTAMAARNHAAGSGPFFLGAGAYRHHVPAAVDHIIQRSEFLTSYTPYQPEIAQGTLQVLFEFQTQVANLTAMEVANASMYDGSTATAEAALMAHRITRRGKALLSGGLNPHYRAAVETISRLSEHAALSLAPDPLGAEDIAAAIDDETSCVIVQSPTFYGQLIELAPIAEAAQRKGALLVAVVTEALSLGALEPPGTAGADIVVGEGQSLGNPLGFGGPYVGLFATREKYVRQMPGRLAGMTHDVEGRRGFVLTLAAREQHIRREKATSNICTNSGLCALAFAAHLALLGETGLQRLAALNHARACRLADALAGISGVALLNEHFFNEFTLRLPRPAVPVVEALAAHGILAGVPVARLEPRRPELADLLLVAATETVTDTDIAALAEALAGALA
jgi:glycine dehydrogenase subunit 1